MSERGLLFGSVKTDQSQDVVTGAMTFSGISADEAAANKNVFVSAIADVASVVEAAIIDLYFRASRRRRLDEASDGVIATYVIEVDGADAAEDLVAVLGAVDPADVDDASAAGSREETGRVSPPEARGTELER